jgi:hypothetical protein
VSNIYQYHLAYKTIAEQRQRERTTKERVKTGDASPGPGLPVLPAA